MLRFILLFKWYFLTYCKKYYFRNRKRLIRWQNRKAPGLIQFAIKNSTFYKQYYSGFSLNTWETLPLLNKKILMENFDDINTANITATKAYETAIKSEISRDFSPTINTITVGLSSGTTGNRGLFLVSEKERIAWAGTIIAKMLPDILFSKQKIAFFLRANSNLYTTLNNHFIQFRFYDLLKNIKTHIEQLNQFQPTLIVAPASLLRMLADAKAQGLLTIAPAKIISVAEVLEPLDKEHIEKQFVQTVHQIYQATEGFLAVTCQYGTLHLNEDLLIIQKEYIDVDRKKFVPIITDLYRTTQPIIRYRLNDILTEREMPCPCGSIFTALSQIDGRCDDLLYFQEVKSKKLQAVFPDFIRNAIMKSSPEILEYLVIQISPLELTINLRCNTSSFDDIQQQIKSNLKMLCEQVTVILPHIHFGEFVMPEAGTKLRRIIRNFSMDE